MTPAGQAASAVDAAELEWQFDALDLRPVLRWLDDHDGRNGAEEFRVAPAGSANQVDLYLDTEDQRFYRAGYALRIRRVNRRRHGEATLKALGGSSPLPGLRDRREVAQHLEDVDVEALQRSDGPVGERVRAVAGRKKLLALFEVRTNRHTFSVSADGLAPGEVALDETRIQPADGSSPARLRRVEVEVPSTAVNAFEPFVEGLRIACALTPAELSKYEAGLLAVDLRSPRPERFGWAPIDPDETIGTLAMNVLRKHFEAFLAREPGTRLGDDVEELHDMRVASRRLRAALSLFGDVLAPAILKLREELAWIGGVLGAVRDLDVQLVELEAWHDAVPEPDRKPLLALRSLLVEQRAVGARRVARGSRLATLRVARQPVRPRAPCAPAAWSRAVVARGARRRARSDPAALRFLSKGRPSYRRRLRARRVPPAPDQGKATPLHARVPRRPVPGREPAARQAPDRASGHPRRAPRRRRRGRAPARPCRRRRRSSRSSDRVRDGRDRGTLPPSGGGARAAGARAYKRIAGKPWKSLQKRLAEQPAPEAPDTSTDETTAPEQEQAPVVED